MLKRLLSYYSIHTPTRYVYMLQQVEYDPNAFLDWLVRMPDMRKVMYRKRLVRTLKAYLLDLYAKYLFAIFTLIVVMIAIKSVVLGLIYLLFVPALTSGCLYITLEFVWLVYEQPRRFRAIRRAEELFTNHSGLKIAILGSYGKTSIKELLLAVLSIERKVAATPGNKNVLISHADWIKQLSGDEDILLIEFGEGAPGDIEKFAKLTQPHAAVLTGLAPNHLNKYKTLQAVKKDLLSIGDFVDHENIYFNADDQGLIDVEGGVRYSHAHVLGWKIQKITIDITGTSFEMKKGKELMKIKSGLLGRHQVGPVAFAAAYARQLGISEKAVVSAISKMKPYEHRMQPRNVSGAWIIDDTYNGNLEGIRAGLRLLSDLTAKRKIYVTPGLVEQGRETRRVHVEIGELIGAGSPDRVVLMKNSVQKHIQQGLKNAGYGGDVVIETDPLNYYTNLEHQLAAGDLVLMQNDWTDNYA